MHPDLGEHLWQLGKRDVVVAMSLTTISEHKTFSEASGLARFDGITYMVTVRTGQSPRAILAEEVQGGVMARGRLLDHTCSGDSGEVYRVVEGTIGVGDGTNPLDALVLDIAKDSEALIALLRNGRALKEDRHLVRAIGERLHRAGGFTAMQAAATFVRSSFPNGEGGEDGWHPAEIDAVWSGIGDWRW